MFSSGKSFFNGVRQFLGALCESVCSLIPWCPTSLMLHFHDALCRWCCNPMMHCAVVLICFRLFSKRTSSLLHPEFQIKKLFDMVYLTKKQHYEQSLAVHRSWFRWPEHVHPDWAFQRKITWYRRVNCYHYHFKTLKLIFLFVCLFSQFNWTDQEWSISMILVIIETRIMVDQWGNAHLAALIMRTCSKAVQISFLKSLQSIAVRQFISFFLFD